MKKLFIPVLAAVSIFAISCSEEETTTMNQQVNTKKLTFSSGLVRGWSESGNCLRDYGNCALAVVGGGFSGQENIMPVKFQLENSTLKIDNLINKVNADGKFLKFYKDTEIDSNVAKELGQNSIIIPAGSYDTDHSQNPNGSTTIKVIIR